MAGFCAKHRHLSCLPGNWSLCSHSLRLPHQSRIQATCFNDPSWRSKTYPVVFSRSSLRKKGLLLVILTCSRARSFRLLNAFRQSQAEEVRYLPNDLSELHLLNIQILTSCSFFQQRLDFLVTIDLEHRQFQLTTAYIRVTYSSAAVRVIDDHDFL